MSTGNASLFVVERSILDYRNRAVIIPVVIAGVRYFGKDFQAIAQLIGTKNTTQVRAFFSAYKKKYNLDGALAEFEMNQKSKLAKSAEMVSRNKSNLNCKVC